ncbi:glycosyltransferase [Thermus scotoductus]
MKPDSQNKAPLSVIIPCYQCKETIGRALASVASQTWPPQEVMPSCATS